MMQTMLFRELTHTDLAWTLGVCAPVVSRMVRALVELGLLKRRTPETDRRVRIVSLTEAGRKALDIFYDGWAPKLDGASIQADAECELLRDWEAPLGASGIRFEWPDNDVGPTLQRIRYLQSRTDYWADDFGVEEAKTMRCHRNYRNRRVG